MFENFMNSFLLVWGIIWGCNRKYGILEIIEVNFESLEDLVYYVLGVFKGIWYGGKFFRKGIWRFRFYIYF